MKNANPTKWHFATAVFAVSAACLSQFCCAGGGCPFGAGTSALTPRIQRLLDRAIDHDVFPRPVKMDSTGSDPEANLILPLFRRPQFGDICREWARRRLRP